MPNFTLERTAGSHALAAAAQRGRSATFKEVPDTIQNQCPEKLEISSETSKPLDL